MPRPWKVAVVFHLCSCHALSSSIEPLNRWDAVKDSPEVSNSKTTQYNLPKCRRCGRFFHVMKRQELWAESDEQPDILGKFLIGFSSSHEFCIVLSYVSG